MLGPSCHTKGRCLHCMIPQNTLQIDLASGTEVKRLPGVGTKAHGLVFWERWVVALDSDAAALVKIDPANGDVQKLWQVCAA